LRNHKLYWHNKKTDGYEKQAKITNEAGKLCRVDEDELSRIEAAINETEVFLKSAAAKLSLARQNLLLAIDKIESKYRGELAINEDALRVHCGKLSYSLGMEVRDDTDFWKLNSELKWCADLKTLKGSHTLGSNFINNACDRDDEFIKKMSSNILALKAWREITSPSYEKFVKLFEQDLRGLTLLQLFDMISSCKDNFASLEYLIDYRIAEKRLADLEMDTYLEKVKEIELNSDKIVPVFEKCFYRSWLDAVIPNYISVRDFRKLSQDEQIASFRELDKSHLEISKAMVLSKLISRVPNLNASSASTNAEVALLKREIPKQRKLMPIRQIIAKLPTLLPALKPCIMMSPLSVSTYFGGSDFEFDVVIFDEASQLRTGNAIGAIFRANQVIIAGDNKQLPPTNFFASIMSTSDEYEEDEDGGVSDTGAYTSLLDEAVMLPTQKLLWHYRSRHEHLIAFSNAKIYGRELMTFPSPEEKADGIGVEYVYVQGGTYDRGGRNGNRTEAAKVVELIFEHFRTHPKRSIGIVAFGKTQQTAIQEALDNKRRANPMFEHFFKEDINEPLFIKNLETVQGDEGDTIILSIDMAVRHPGYNGRFAIGIECDGATYHSARTARERDRLRQTLLEDIGWKIYRIWSTDWIKDSNTAGDRLLAAVKKAINDYHEPI